MRKPASFNHRIDKGATYSKVFAMKVKATGLPFDLTGYTAKADLEDRGGAVVLGAKTELNPVIDAALGTITLSLSSAVTAAFTGSTAGLQTGKKPVGDILITSSGGTTTKIAEIIFDVLPTVAE